MGLISRVSSRTYRKNLCKNRVIGSNPEPCPVQTNTRWLPPTVSCLIRPVIPADPRTRETFKTKIHSPCSSRPKLTPSRTPSRPKRTRQRPRRTPNSQPRRPPPQPSPATRRKPTKSITDETTDHDESQRETSSSAGDHDKSELHETVNRLWLRT